MLEFPWTSIVCDGAEKREEKVPMDEHLSSGPKIRTAEITMDEQLKTAINAVVTTNVETVALMSKGQN